MIQNILLIQNHYNTREVQIVEPELMGFIIIIHFTVFYIYNWQLNKQLIFQGGRKPNRGGGGGRNPSRGGGGGGGGGGNQNRGGGGSCPRVSPLSAAQCRCLTEL